MPVKFNQYWPINYEQLPEYEKFITRKFIPVINKLGIHIVAGWTVLIGGYSDIIMEGVANDLDLLEKALRDAKYRQLNDELQNYVKNYKTKVLVTTGHKEDYSKDMLKNTVKFSQMWDILSHKKTQYREYVDSAFYPCLEELGIKVAREWEVLIGEGPRTLCEGRAADIDSNTLISNLQQQKFQKAKKGLKHFVENYESRILIFHIQKVLGYKSASYELVTS
jgi:hypothetical protein